jgi:hypothetical protein
MGAAAGSAGGAVLSPNPESRGLNTLVFGLAGALVGGVAGLLTYDDGRIPPAHSSLEERERASLREFSAAPSEPVPPFVRDRLQPVVIEEYTEGDSVSDDGSLHEPHRAYRIKQPAELFARPGENVRPKEEKTR